MTREEMITATSKAGANAALKGKLRVSPYYEEKATLDGKRTDITSILDKGWYEGYDDCTERVNA